MRIWRIVSFGILVSACGIPILFGQQDKGTIVGLVEDSSGASIPTAKVTLRNAGTGETRTTNTGTPGEFVFTPLMVGIYDVTVEAADFQTQVSGPRIAGPTETRRPVHATGWRPIAGDRSHGHRSATSDGRLLPWPGRRSPRGCKPPVEWPQYLPTHRPGAGSRDGP